MTTREVRDMIASIGLPFAYYQFPENTAQAPPVLCFYYAKSRNFHADDTVYSAAEELIVELYTPEKRFDLEAQIEETFNARGLAWTREENFLKAERLIVEVYRLTVPLDKEG